MRSGAGGPGSTADHGLRRALEQAELYLRAAPSFLVVLDRQHRVQLVNAYGCRVLGYEEGELLGRDWYEVAVAPRDRGRLRTAFREVMDGRRSFEPEIDSHLLTRTGDERIVRWRRTLLHEGEAVIGTLSAGEDVTDRIRAEKALAHVLAHDPLTGLENRAAFDARLARAVDRRAADEALVLLSLDVDDLRTVNETLGHRSGDALLAELARRIQGAMAGEEGVARRGGDEFVVLIERVPAPAAVEVGLAAADQVAHALHPPFDLDGAEVHVSASVGISLLPGDAADAVELLAHADHATYAAKRAGGGAHRYVPRAPRTTSTPEDLALGTRLDRALAAGHITAHLQPVVDVSTCHVTAYEALARWLDPERGLLPPAAFLPWAERRGPIDRIRGEVVDVVCAALGTLDHLGGTPWIAINVSARELLAPGFVAGLMAAADRHAVPPDRLVVELTETAVMGDPDRATAVLAALRSTSVRVAIDDFGAGYSSMARLRTLPVDVLKIDAGLLDGVPEDEGAVAVLAALVELGRALGLSVVAEGVERPEQHEVLVDLRCPLAQGWLYGRPAPAERWHGVSAVPRPGGAVAPTP